jgi:hypothetical protein
LIGRTPIKVDVNGIVAFVEVYVDPTSIGVRRGAIAREPLM